MFIRSNFVSEPRARIVFAAIIVAFMAAAFSKPAKLPFDRFERHPLPPWATEIDCDNWAQFFLKFIVSHPAVTCAIPATSKVDHMRENMGAALGRLPDPETRRRMIPYVESL